MSYLEAIILGIVQGLGEFLPISSSAHLVIAPWFLKFNDPGLAFDVALHLGTLIAVLAYFWRDWWNMTEGSWKYLTSKNDAVKRNFQSDFQLLLYLVLATIPGAVIGLLIKDYAESSLRHPLLVALNMIVLGLLLFFADQKGEEKQTTLSQITLKMALLIGFSQALALLPGVSRSGITITTALFLGLSRTSSARFSFLLSTPIILGACVLNAKYILDAFIDPQALVGIVMAAVFGFLSIKYLMKLVQNFSYRVFCYYRFFFGAGVIFLYYLRL